MKLFYIIYFALRNVNHRIYHAINNFYVAHARLIYLTFKQLREKLKSYIRISNVRDVFPMIPSQLSIVSNRFIYRTPDTVGATKRARGVTK